MRDTVYFTLPYAQKNKANYLLNIALRGDGSIHPADQSTLQGFADLKD